MNPSLRIATILLFVRAGWAGGVALSCLGLAAIFWGGRSTGPLSDSQIVETVIAVFIAGGLAVTGAVAIAIAIPSLAFALLLLTRKRWASWVVMVGESLVTIALVGVTVEVGGDKSLAAILVAAIAVLFVPVIFLLVRALPKQKP